MAQFSGHDVFWKAIMTFKILATRYEFNNEGQALINISVNSIGDLFNSFDKKSVFSRRELDQDFVDYLIDSIKEVGSHDFKIRILIDKEFSIMQENLLRKAVKSFFTYMLELEKMKFKREMKKFFLLLIGGIVLLTLVSVYRVPNLPEAEAWMMILHEGLVIAAWVGIWEALTALIFAWGPFFNNKRNYQRIISADLEILNNMQRLVL